jgi:hypothetical protein
MHCIRCQMTGKVNMQFQSMAPGDYVFALKREKYMMWS